MPQLSHWSRGKQQSSSVPMESRDGSREEGESLGEERRDQGHRGGRQKEFGGSGAGRAGAEERLWTSRRALKRRQEEKKKQEKMCGERILPWDGAGHSAAVPMQNSKPPELINISTHFLRQAASLTLQRDPRRQSKGFVTAETVKPPPAPCSYPQRAPRAVSDST